MPHKISRRSVMVGSGIAITGAIGVGSTVTADGHDVPVVIESVTPEQDLIVLRNQGDSTVNLSGYIINWEYENQERDQFNELPEGTEIAAGGELRITSGYYDTEADVAYDYDNGRINNDGSDVIALSTPSRQNVVSVFNTSTGETEPGDPVDDGSDEEEEEESEEEEPEEEEEESDPEEEPEEEHEIPVSIVSVDVESEHIVLTNEGDEDVDLSGYIVNYHWDRDLPREAGTEDTIPDNAVIEAGGELVLDTGCTDEGGHDVRLGDYGNCQYIDDREFVVVLLSPDGNVVDRFTHSEDEQPEEEEEGDEPEEESEEEEEPEDKPEEEEGAEEEEGKEEPEEGEEPAEDFPQQYEAQLTGEAHGVETEASGHARFEVHDHDDGMDAHYELMVENICNVTQAHIHLGAEGEDGPVVVWLYPEDTQEPELVEGRFSGMLAEGTITPDDFVGEWKGADFEDACMAFEDRGAYVNVHTEEHPAGEIRGQIEPAVGL